MRIYETTATHRLEDEAKKLDMELEIRLIEPHKDGRFFVTAINGEKLKVPSSLGWSDAHALVALRRNTWKHGRIDLW